MMALMRKRIKLLKLGWRIWRRRVRTINRQTHSRRVVKRQLLVELITSIRCVEVERLGLCKRGYAQFCCVSCCCCCTWVFCSDVVAVGTGNERCW